MKLTDYQIELLEAIAAGDDFEKICEDYGIHIRTLRNHVYRIRTAMGCNSPIQMVVKFIKLRHEGKL